MLSTGDRTGPYQVLGPLGAGGMGEVWRALDTRLGREVALKVLPDSFLGDAARVARFEREARLLASLNHPGIATVHGFEQVNGVSLLVLELVEGRTLAERLRRGRWPMREALQIAIAIAEALEAAHGKGIVHRDLKPSNVKLTTKAFQLLELLIEARPRVVTKAQIYDRLWPKTYVAEVNLSRLVFELRKALGDDARTPRWVGTARGYGYAFAADERDGASAAGAASWCRLILSDREVLLTEGDNVLGRTHDATVWLPAKSVSRRHARITVSGRNAMLEDLGSKNGTRYDGREVTAPVPLRDGHEFTVGTVSMTFRVVPPEESTATEAKRR